MLLRTHISASDLSQSYGDTTVFTGLTLVASPGDRLGLIGENGAGKSTLLRLIAGIEQPASGSVLRPESTALLQQELVFEPHETVHDLIERSISDLRAIEAELQDAAAALADGPPAESRYSLALEAAERADLWSVDARRAELLAGLGLGGLDSVARSPASPAASAAGSPSPHCCCPGLRHCCSTSRPTT